MPSLLAIELDQSGQHTPDGLAVLLGEVGQLSEQADELGILLGGQPPDSRERPPLVRYLRRT